LQIYSSSPANDLFYVGSSFDSSDYVDYSRIENQEYLPLIKNGAATLSVTSSQTWPVDRVYVDESNSNGFYGNNHSVYLDEKGQYVYYFTLSPTSRSSTNAADGNPLTFFEYEQVNLIGSKPTDSKSFEFKYIDDTPNTKNENYIDWSSFNTNKLKLTMVLENDTAEPANYVLINPYFGDNGYISKDIIVSKIEVTDDKKNVENILQSPIYISSSFIPSSLDVSKNFYYREANIKFLQRNVKSIKIYFEQENATTTKIKNVYFRPDPALVKSDSPYYNQSRFDPNSPSIPTGEIYPEVAWSNVTFKDSDLIPSLSRPNAYKSEVFNTITPQIVLKRDVPAKKGWGIKVVKKDGKAFYLTNYFIGSFSQSENRLEGYTGITAANLTEYITESKSLSQSLYSIWISPDDATNIRTSILTWFNTTTQNGINNANVTSQQKYTAFDISSISIVSIESDNKETKQKQYSVPLSREFEVLEAERKSISIRDITLGVESYSNRGQIISRPFSFISNIEFLTISAESSLSGIVPSGSVDDYIQYYISLDNGKQWIQIASIESPSAQVGEVISLNQNVDQKFKIPGVEYYNAPAIPQDPKEVLVKIDFKKPDSTNITPILYSYKLGVKVKQI
jgi:hypothetical protein